MKKNIFIILISIIAITSVIGYGMNSIGNIGHEKYKGNIKVDIPENIQTIIDKSCIVCHHSDAKNPASKLSISFDKLKAGDYSVAKVVGKLNNVVKTVDEGSMPPAKFIENNPQKKLSDNEKKLLKDWALATIAKYSEE
jgi:cytochrome c551/c552